jgi:hypothetical protein
VSFCKLSIKDKTNIQNAEEKKNNSFISKFPVNHYLHYFFAMQKYPTVKTSIAWELKKNFQLKLRIKE